MEKKNIQKMPMTNKEIMDSVLKEITNMGFHIKDVEYGDGYFIFESGENSVCHFHIKELKGFKFALWTTTCFDDIEKQIKENGVGWTWANSLEIDPRSDVVFFTQYERDLDKFKPSRSGFVYGLYLDSWEEENDKGVVEKVTRWRELDGIEAILKYMKNHYYKAVEYSGRQTRYIWEDDISGFKAFLQFIYDWNYTLRHRFYDYIKLQNTIRASKRLVGKIKQSYGVVMDRGVNWHPRIEILIRRKSNVDIDKYIEEQAMIDKFENKYWNNMSLTQFDIDITEEHITDKELEIDKDEKQHFIKYVTNIGKLEDDERKIIYSNIKGEIK